VPTQQPKGQLQTQHTVDIGNSIKDKHKINTIIIIPLNINNNNTNDNNDNLIVNSSTAQRLLLIQSQK
jgi:hypothetical protein